MSTGQPGAGPTRTASFPKPGPDHLTVILDVDLRDTSNGIRLTLTKQKLRVTTNGLILDGEPVVEHRIVGPFSIPVE